MNLTWFDGNSWLIEMAGARVLLDPWLVGDLTFGNAPWFFKGSHQAPIPLPENINLILLSQGLPDHAHPPTLEQFDRSIPVVGSPNAAKVAQSLGFQSVTAVAHGESFVWQDRLKIHAFPGSLVGPQLVENAYVVEDLQQQTKLYYEPHGNHSPALQSMAPIDVAIIPVLDMKLPLVGAFIRGGDHALKLIRAIKPQVVVPCTASQATDYEGFLPKLIAMEGTLDAFRDRVHQILPATQVLSPTLFESTPILLPTKQTV